MKLKLTERRAHGSEVLRDSKDQTESIEDGYGEQRDRCTRKAPKTQSKSNAGTESEDNDLAELKLLEMALGIRSKEWKLHMMRENAEIRQIKIQEGDQRAIESAKAKMKANMRKERGTRYLAKNLNIKLNPICMMMERHGK